jgi:DNA-binding MarR family transcriptional regulator
MALDPAGLGAYSSVMNDVATDGTKPEVSARPTEATLFTFLDVADQLYERVEAALDRVGLSYPKYEVLKCLRTCREPLALSALAEEQSCARSNITQLVDRLEAEGLVRRVADPDDRRSVRAELTEEGMARETEGTTQLNLVLAEFAASFSAPERAELARLLSRLR